MNKKTLYKLEFDKIINMLTEHASSREENRPVRS